MRRFTTRQWLLFPLVLCSLILFVVGIAANPQLSSAAQVVQGISPSTPFSHTLWDTTLTDVVSAEGWVDFSHLKAYPRQFNAYLQLLEQVSPQSHPTLFPTSAAQTAYWLNAYNALLLRYTLDVYPVETAVPVEKRLAQTVGHYRIGGYPTTLDELRSLAETSGAADGIPASVIDAGLTSLTLAGPTLLPEAFTATQLQRQLTLLAKKQKPYAALRQQTSATCQRWIIQFLDRRSGKNNRYTPNTRLPIEFPLPVPRPQLPTVMPYSEKPLYHYCLSPSDEQPPSPLLLMDVWQLLP
jgi:hypothetical protein